MLVLERDNEIIYDEETRGHIDIGSYKARSKAFSSRTNLLSLIWREKIFISN